MAPDEAGALAGARALSAAGVPTLIVQGASDAVIHADGPARLQAQMAPGLCEVVSLDGFGHFGHPKIDGGRFLSAAYEPAADFLGH